MSRKFTLPHSLCVTQIHYRYAIHMHFLVFFLHFLKYKFRAGYKLLKLAILLGKLRSGGPGTKASLGK
jgi:hypothetical protein